MIHVNNQNSTVVIEVKRPDPINFRQDIIRSISSIMQLYILNEASSTLYTKDYERLYTLSALLNALTEGDSMQSDFVPVLIDKKQQVLKIEIPCTNPPDFVAALRKLSIAVLRWCHSGYDGTVDEYGIYVFSEFMEEVESEVRMNVAA